MMPAGPILQDWRRAHGEPVFQGVIRHTCSDFEVRERLGFEPSGAGEHDYLWIEKTHANTSWVAGRLAAHAGIPARDVGYAGMKDRRAVTRQWFSVRRKSGAGTDWANFDAPGVRLLEISRHARKLRRGAHKANRFRIIVRASGIPDPVLEDRICTIRKLGVPNYFGEQRFGRDGANIDLAEALFAGERLSGAKRSIALSAARSALFNHILQQRVIDGTWNRLIPGEAACLDGSNSIFPVADFDDDLQRRCNELDVHPGGALWGRGEPNCDGQVRELERSIVSYYANLRDGVEGHTVQGRRALRQPVRDFSFDVSGAELRLRFELGGGGFATAVLRELLDYDSDGRRAG